MLGLGDKEHNRRVREERERRRPVLTSVKEEYTFMEYLGLLHERSSDEGRKAETAGTSGTGRHPVSEKFMRRGGKLTGNEEDE